MDGPSRGAFAIPERKRTRGSDDDDRSSPASAPPKKKAGCKKSGGLGGGSAAATVPTFPIKDMADRQHDFFLHHCHASGQDQCGNLDKLLRQEGARVWIDMQAEDLTLTGMEKGISESRNFVIFLSKGIMGREYIDAEQRWAIQYGCNIIGIVEKDEQHGKADFAEEKAHAPADLKHLLDDVEFLDYERRGYKERCMVDEILRQAGMPRGQTPLDSALTQSDQPPPRPSRPQPTAFTTWPPQASAVQGLVAAAMAPDTLSTRTMAIDTVSTSDHGYRYLVYVGGEIDATQELPQMTADRLRRLKDPQEICMAATDPKQYPSPGQQDASSTHAKLSRAEQLRKSRFPGNDAHELDAAHAIPLQKDSLPLQCGDLVLTKRSSGEIQYAQIISNEKAALLKDWTPEQLSSWLRHAKLENLRAFDQMDGKMFIKFFDKSTAEDMEAALQDDPRFVRAHLRTLRERLRELLGPFLPHWGWMRCLSPPRILDDYALNPSPPRSNGFAVGSPTGPDRNEAPTASAAAAAAAVHAAATTAAAAVAAGPQAPCSGVGSRSSRIADATTGSVRSRLLLQCTTFDPPLGDSKQVPREDPPPSNQ